MATPNGSTDSFYMQLDDGSSSQATITQGAWNWKAAGSKLNLSSGTHTLKLKNREDGASVDKILLTKDKNYKPSALGDAALTFLCR